MKKTMLRLFIAFFFIYCIVMLLLTSFFYEHGFRYNNPISSEEIKTKFASYPHLTKQRFEINSKDNITLVGYLYNQAQSENTPKATIVLSHGLGLTHSDYLHEIDYFVKNGYQVFGFDNTGNGESGGNSIKGLSRSLIDLDYTLTFLENTEEFSKIPILLYGHSWGGFAVCAVNNKPHNVTGITERSGFNETVDIMYEKISDTIGKPIANLLAPFIHIYEWIKFGKYSIYSATDGLNNSNCPALLMHSTNDPVVPLKNSIVGNKNKITNPHVIVKEYNDKSHYITSIVKNDEIIATDTSVLNMIVKFYDSACQIQKERGY